MYYVGFSEELKSRFNKHKNGEVPHTSKFRPLNLAWFSCFKNKDKAAKFEKYLKSSSGKAFRNKHLI